MKKWSSKSNEKLELEIKNIIPFTLAHMKKYLGLNLTKYVKINMRKSTIFWWKKSKLNKWRASPCSWTRKLNIIKMSVPPNFICRLNAILIKIPESYFMDNNKLIPKYIWKCKRLRISQHTTEEQSQKIDTIQLQTILQSFSNQDSMVLAQKQKYRSMDQDRKPRVKPTHI